MQRQFAIREVCRLLGLRPHVVRYWEREVPLLSPKKGVSGHRVYGWSDLETLFRIRHLLHDKGYTLDGVSRRLWEEAAAEYQDTKAQIFAVRATLWDLTDRIMSLREACDQVLSKSNR